MITGALEDLGVEAPARRRRVTREAPTAAHGPSC